MRLEDIIQIQDLKKSYKGQEAVRGISFSVKKGQFFALLGPNGAGKSTTVNIICTSMKQDSGVVKIDGLKVGRRDFEIRKKIGVVFQNGVLDELLTVEENLHTRGSFYGIRGYDLKQRIQEIARLTGITEFIERPYGKLSGGQKRRCDIARALLHQPKILILDEPTTGLDPKMRSAIWETIDTIKKKTDMTLFLTTHYMEEAAKADHIVILKNGRIALEGTPLELKRKFSKDNLFLLSHKCDLLKSMLERKGIACFLKKEGIEVPLHTTLDALSVLEYCRGRYYDFEVHRGSMDDAYLSVIEKEERDV